MQLLDSRMLQMSVECFITCKLTVLSKILVVPKMDDGHEKKVYFLIFVFFTFCTPKTLSVQIQVTLITLIQISIWIFQSMGGLIAPLFLFAKFWFFILFCANKGSREPWIAIITEMGLLCNIQSELDWSTRKAAVHVIDW